MSCNCNKKDIPSIRIGNDIDIRWAIYNGVESVGESVMMEPYRVEGKSISVYFNSKYDRQRADYVHLEDNIVHCRFFGKDQKFFGPYSVVVIENEGQQGMHTLDECKAFELVSCECDVDRHNGNGFISVSTIELETIAQIGIAGEKVEIDEELDDASENPVQNKAISAALKTKVDKEEGKGLSSNDFDDYYKGKLESLVNYDDTDVKDAIRDLGDEIDALVEGGKADAIDSFNDFVEFFEGTDKGVTLKDIVANISDNVNSALVIHTDLNFNTLTNDLETTGMIENSGVTYDEIKHFVEKCRPIVLQQSDGKICYCTRAEIVKILGSYILHFIKDYGNIQYDIQLLASKTNNIAYTINRVSTLPDTELSETSTQSIENKAVTLALKKKVDYVDGKQLSDENFTTELKEKLEELSEYNDEGLTGAVAELQVAVADAEKYDSKIADKTIKVVEDYGDIKKGTELKSINGKSYSELFDAILFPTIYPDFVNPSVSLALRQYTSLQEVGADAPTASNLVSTFSMGAINLNGVKQSGRAGSLKETVLYVSAYTANPTLPAKVTLGDTKYYSRAYYEAGPQPYDNKGNKYGNPLSSGFVDSSAVTIFGTYPWYATTSGATNGTPIKQSLIKWNEGNMTSPEFTLLPTSTCKQVISTPSEIKEIYAKDASGNFILTDLNEFTKTTETRNGRTYYKYEYNGKARGSVTFKIKF